LNLQCCESLKSRSKELGSGTDGSVICLSVHLTSLTLLTLLMLCIQTVFEM